MTVKDACTLLGLGANADEPEIRRAFKQVALQCHPDRFRTFTQQAWATRKFQRLVAARDLLQKNRL